MPNPFWVVDLDRSGQIQLKEQYDHDSLSSIDLAAILIAEFATYLWRDPQGFELKIPGTHGMSMRWYPSADTAGIATLRCRGTLTSMSLLASGMHSQSDALTLRAAQDHLVREMHDTGFEPAFDLVQIPERPLVASLHFAAPEDPTNRAVFALSDRCFAAAYFRYLGLG